MKSLLVLTLIAVEFCSLSSAQDSGTATSAATQQSLTKTQQLLKDKKARQAVIAKDPTAKEADDFTKNLMGSDKLTGEVYSLAAEVLAIVVKDAQGDPVKMKEALEKFARDPASFVEKWTPEQRAKLKKLSGEIPQPVLNH